MTKYQFLSGNQFYASSQQTVYMFKKSNVCGMGMVLINNAGHWSFSCTVSKINETTVWVYTSIMGAPITLVISLKSLTCLTCV